MLAHERGINTFSHHYRKKYGEPVGKLPIDVGLPCPNREKGGCIFCRPASFTPTYLSAKDPVTHQIERGKKSLLHKRFKRYLAYFQQETCTALPAEQLLDIITKVLADPACLGLIISTRPDYIHDDFLTGLAQIIKACGKECLFEIGMQSSHERSLTLLNRNHSFVDVANAISRIKLAGPFSTGVHLIFGIPGESEKDMLDSVQSAVDLGVSAVKLHQLQVIRETALEELYMNGHVLPFTLEAYIELLVKIIAYLPTNVVIHRLWATSHPDLLVAPKWNILAAHLRKTLDDSLKQSSIVQGQWYEGNQR